MVFANSYHKIGINLMIVIRMLPGFEVLKTHPVHGSDSLYASDLEKKSTSRIYKEELPYPAVSQALRQSLIPIFLLEVPSLLAALGACFLRSRPDRDFGPIGVTGLGLEI
jgi:hypothetical protein